MWLGTRRGEEAAASLCIDTYAKDNNALSVSD